MIHGEISFLKNAVKNYSWGSTTSLLDFTGHSSSDVKEAEVWMGAHALGCSRAQMGGRESSLDALIRESPETFLGPETARMFNRQLPFLFKVLAVNDPLSLQAHPNAQQAEAGFVLENSRNIPLDSPIRNFKDPNSKPEIICALSSFWALKGFRNSEQIRALLEPIQRPRITNLFNALKQESSDSGLRTFFSLLLNLKENEKNELLDEVLHALQKLEKNNSSYEWVLKLHQKYPGDIGVLSPLFLNVINLKPGQALYLPARELHCYLNGLGIELMGNSDNVLRGGLTSKHVDLQGLLSILNFKGSEAAVLEPVKVSEMEFSYQSPSEEFLLSRINLDGKIYQKENLKTLEIMVCTEGEGFIESQGKKLEFTRGRSWVIPACVSAYRLSGKACIYKASAPIL